MSALVAAYLRVLEEDRRVVPGPDDALTLLRQAAGRSAATVYPVPPEGTQRRSPAGLLATASAGRLRPRPSSGLHPSLRVGVHQLALPTDAVKPAVQVVDAPPRPAAGVVRPTVNVRADGRRRAVRLTAVEVRRVVAPDVPLLPARSALPLAAIAPSTRPARPRLTRLPELRYWRLVLGRRLLL